MNEFLQQFFPIADSSRAFVSYYLQYVHLVGTGYLFRKTKPAQGQ